MKISMNQSTQKWSSNSFGQKKHLERPCLHVQKMHVQKKRYYQVLSMKILAARISTRMKLKKCSSEHAKKLQQITQ